MIVKIVLGLFTLLITLAPAYAQAGGDFDAAAESEMVQLLNQARQQAGLAPLTVDDRLTRAAREHTKLLAQHGALSHQFSGEPSVTQRVAATGIRFNLDAENVALDSGTAADVHRGLMNSPRHRANIMNPDLNAVGVGVVRQGSIMYVTEDFARRIEEYAPAQAEDLAASAVLRQRRQARAPAIVRTNPRALRGLACRMARSGHLATQTALAETAAHYAVSYTRGEPDTLPSDAVRLAADPTLKQFAVGACYGKTEKYPGGIWWIVMVFY